MGRELAQRAAAQRNGSASGGGAEVEQVRTLADQIRKMQPEYQAAMPKGMEAAQLVRDAITCLRTIRKLDQCEPMSVLGALMTTAQLGLRPAVLGHAWPLPFWDNRAKCYKAQLVIGYQGYVELGYRSGQLAGITSRIVYTEDDFDVIYYADRDELVHKPAKDGLRENIRCFYSAARMVNGGYSVTDPMSLAAMEAYREAHAASKDREGKVFGPWIDNFPAMGQKTMIRMNFKLLPKSPEMAIAMEADEGVRVNLEPGVSAEEVTEHPRGVVPGEVEPSDDAGGEEPGMAGGAADPGRPLAGADPMTHPLNNATPARKCVCGHYARTDEVTSCRFCDCTHHRASQSPHQGYDPQTPPGAEAALQSFSDALDEARELLAEKRDLEVDALAALKEAKRRALLSPECPKVRRNECTVAERDAWAEDQCAEQERAWMLARATRQAATDHLKTVGKQGGFQQSIAGSVREQYRGAGQWGGPR